MNTEHCLMKIKAFTDGSAINVGGKKGSREGGLGIVLILEDGTVKKFSRGVFKNTTSARMEIEAIIQTLHFIQPGNEIEIYSDNEYCVKTINEWLEGWIEKGILHKKANTDLWKRYYALERLHGKENIKANWVRGHNGTEYNEMADQLANKGRLSESVAAEDHQEWPGKFLKSNKNF